ERFAGALTLMLRSCNIPARVVIGFRGAENQGDGVYVVRKNYAHSWVEALVPHDKDGLRDLPPDWLNLDPTPPSENAPARSFWFWRWLQQRWDSSDLLWRELVLGLNADSQAHFWNSVMSRRGPIPFLLRFFPVVAVLLVVFWLAEKVWRRVKRWRRAA